MRSFASRNRAAIVAWCCVVLVGITGAITAGASDGEKIHFSIPSQDLQSALSEFALQSKKDVLFSPEIAASKRSSELSGEYDTRSALKLLLSGTGLTFRTPDDHTFLVDVASATTSNAMPASSTESIRLAQADQGTPSGSTTEERGSNTPTSSQKESSTLEDIVITAQRREEKLDKVPISVTAFTQRTMDDLHIQTFSDLASIVPGLIVSTPAASNQDNGDVAIRGIFSGGNAPTTQFYIDETPVAVRTLPGAGPLGSPRPEIFDLDRIEVLRGPQGTLFGSSAMGGAIRYITPQPNLEDTSGFTKAEMSYTDRGDLNYEVGVAYGAPIITGSAGFRVSGWFQEEGGWIDHEDPFTGDILKRNANSSDAYVIRPAFTWVPTEGMTITPALFLQHTHSAFPSTYWLDYLPNPESGAHTSATIQPEPSTDDLRVSSLAIKYDFAGLSFQSDTSYLDRQSVVLNDFTHAAEDIFGGTPFVPGLTHSYDNYEDDISYTHAWQQEFRLSSQDPSSRVNWVAGMYYRHSVQSLVQILPGSLDPLTEAIAGEDTLQFTGNPNYVLNGMVVNAYTNYQATDISEAAFGEVTVGIVSQLKANVGVRIEHSVVEGQNEISAGPSDGVKFFDQTLPDQSGNPVTPRFGLTYQFTDQSMVYVSAAKGYRAGGGNSATSIGNSLCGPSLAALGMAGVPNSFNSDSLWSYELGTKDSLFDRRLAIEASVYYIDWTNIQTQIGLPSCAENFTTNRGKAVSQGFDLQVAAIPVEGLKLGVNVGYTDAYYPDAAVGAPSNGVTPLLNAAGDKLANVLPWTASANAEYSRDISPLWAGSQSYLRVDYRWLSAANALNPNVAGYDSMTGPYQNVAYGVLNLRLGVLHGGLDLSTFVNNAGNADPRLSYTHDAGGDPLIFATAIRPLTAGVTAFYRF
jgi:iron complex outermembrane recepter protein